MKKLFVWVILMFTLVSWLFSCSPTDDETPSPNQDAKMFNIVVGSDFGSEKWYDFYKAAELYFGSVPNVANDAYVESDTEIVIGKSERQISKIAYNKLENYKKTSERSSAYLVYSDGRSVAIAYQNDRFEIGAALDTVIDLMIEKLGTVRLGEMPKGVVCSGEIDPIEWQSDRDDERREIEWLELAEEIGGEHGTEVVNAIKQYYSIISSDIVVWLANLYDFETGGFYYSNSGRNTVGYAPDLESTHQALSFLANMGALEPIGGSPSNLPQSMKSVMIKWVKSLQDPNGYFYHPQWDKALTNSHYSRLGRDLDHAVTLLSYGGARPTYDTPSGVKGDYTFVDGTKVDKNGNVILPTSKLVAPLSDSDVASVSKVVAVNAVPATLQSETAFRAYLAGLDIKNNSYSVGNELTSQSTQFKNREAQLKEKGAGWSLIGILEEWLYVNQNPENGLWYYIDESDPGWSAYDGVNGLLKISSMYNNLGIEFNYPLEAVRSAIKGIYTEEIPGSVCFAYNAWFSVANIFQNLSNHADDPAEASRTIAEIRATLMADAPYLIEHTGSKILQFINDDGSFSFTQASSSPTSQGMPVAVPDTKEGDVNATEICAHGTAGYMFSALGLTVPDRFGAAEWYTFIATLDELGDIVKDEEIPSEPETFDEYGIGELPEGIDAAIKSGGSAFVVNDPRGGKGKVLRYDSKNDGGDQLNMSVQYSPATTCFVYEADMCFESGDTTYVSQLWLSNNYMLGFKIDGDRVNIFDSSSQGSPRLEQDFGMTVGLGEWFNLRVEYYTGDHDTVRIKVYINDELCVVSDNYYDYYGHKLTEGVGTPYNTYYSIGLIGFSTANVTILIDNLLITKTRDQYVAELDPNDQPLYFNIDAPDNERVIHGFENSADDYGEELIVTSDGKLMLENSSSARIPLNLISNKAKCFSFGVSIKNGSVDSSVLTVNFTDIDNKTLHKVLLSFDFDGKIVISSDTKVDAVLENGIDISTEVGVSIDYYPEKGMYLVYIDGKLAGSGNATRYIGNLPAVCAAQLSCDNTLLLDDVYFEKRVSSFDAAVMPDGARSVEKFDGTENGTQLIGDVSVQADGALKYAIVKADGRILTPINKRSRLGGSIVFGASVMIPEYANNDSLTITLCDQNGNSLVEYAISTQGLSESTKYNRYDPIAPLSVGAFVDVAFEVYPGNDIVKIFVGGTLVAVSSIYYTDNVDFTKADRLVITTSSQEYYVDNIYLESYFKPYKKDTLASRESSTPIYDFNQVTTGTLSSRFSLSSVTGYMGVKESLRSGSYDKVLSFKTLAGSYDSFYVSLLDYKEKYNTTAFEADMMISYDSNAVTSSELIFSDKKNGLSYLLIISRGSDGHLWIRDISSHSGSGRVYGKETNLDISEDEWFKIRVEYRHGSRNTVKIITYINGISVYESTNYYGKSTVDPEKAPYGVIDRFRISTYTDMEATIYLDNVYFEREALDIPGVPDTPYGPAEDGKVITYEESTTDNPPLRITTLLSSSDADMRIEELMRSEQNKRVLAFRTGAGNNDYLYVGKTLRDEGKSAAVFESDIKLSYMDGTKDTTFELYLIDENGKNAYLMLLNTDGENISIHDVSGNSGTSVPGRIFGDLISTQAKVDEWFVLKVEYIYGDKDSVRIITYINNEKVLESNNFYGKSTQNLTAEPLNYVARAAIVSYWSTDATIYLDNTRLWDEDVEISVTPDPEPEPTPEPEQKPEPEPSEGEAILDFENGETPSKIVHSAGNINAAGNTSSGSVVADTTGNGTNVYSFSVDQNSGANIVINTTKSTEGDNVFVFETDIDPAFSDNGTPIFYVYFRDSEGRYVYALQVMKDTDNTLSMYDISTWDWKSVNGSKITLPDGWFNLKVEYYASTNKSDVRIKLYVDGTPVYTSSNIFTSFSYADYSSMSSVMIQFYSNATAELRLDNTGLYSVGKEFSED